MKRSLLLAVVAVVAVVATSVAAPARAAASPYVVYEAYPVKPHGPSTVPVRVIPNDNKAESVLTSFLYLAPREEGGYERRLFSVNEGKGFGSMLWSFQPTPGGRYLMAAPRGKVRFLSLSGYWRVRATTVGFRTVSAEQADEEAVGGTGLTQFRSAKAPGGPYGSIAQLHLPCDGGAGTWTFGTDKEPDGDAKLCAVRPVDTFAETHTRATWLAAGPVVGEHASTYRLIVFDFPRR